MKKKILFFTFFAINNMFGFLDQRGQLLLENDRLIAENEQLNFENEDLVRTIESLEERLRAQARNLRSIALERDRLLAQSQIWNKIIMCFGIKKNS